MSARSSVLALGCAQAYDRGERLYSQGDVAGALAVWRGIPETSREYPRAHARLETIEAELGVEPRSATRSARSSSRARAGWPRRCLYYRLALKLDPDRPATLERVQKLFRELHAQKDAERKQLAAALKAGNLRAANAAAEKLSRLDPFDPAIQIEVRQVYAETGAQVMRSLEDGKRAYALGDRAGASAAFSRALELDPQNEAALGYLSYIRRYDQELADEDQRRRSTKAAAAAAGAPPPPTLSSQEILAEGHFRAGQQAEEAGDPYARAPGVHRGARRRRQARGRAPADSLRCARSSRRASPRCTSRASTTSRTRTSRRRSRSGATRS